MKTTAKILVLLMMAAIAPVAISSDYGGATYIENQKDVLRDLQGVYVFVKAINNQRSNWAFDLTIQDEVEHQLNEFGINILSETDVSWAPGRPILKISVDTTEVPATDLDIHSFSIIVSLQEAVSLERDPSRKTHAITWQRWSSGVAERGELELFIRQTVSKIIDVMIDEHLVGKDHPFD